MRSEGSLARATHRPPARVSLPPRPQALSDYVRRFTAEHALEKGSPPVVSSVAKLFRTLAYENKDRCVRSASLSLSILSSGGHSDRGDRQPADWQAALHGRAPARGVKTSSKLVALTPRRVDSVLSNSPSPSLVCAGSWRA